MKKNELGMPGTLDGPPPTSENSKAFKAGEIAGTIIGAATVVAAVAVSAIIAVVAVIWTVRGLGWLIGHTF